MDQRNLEAGTSRYPLRGTLGAPISFGAPGTLGTASSFSAPSTFGCYLHKTRTVNRTWDGSVTRAMLRLGSEGDASWPNHSFGQAYSGSEGNPGTTFGLVVPSGVLHLGPALAYP